MVKRRRGKERDVEDATFAVHDTTAICHSTSSVLRETSASRSSSSSISLSSHLLWLWPSAKPMELAA